MDRFTKSVFGLGIPLMAFLVLNDSAYVFQKDLSSDTLAYVIVEPEELVAEEELEAVEEEPVVEETAAEGVEESAEEVAEVEVEATPEAEAVVEAEAAPEVEVAEVADAGSALLLTEDELADANRQMRKCKACHQLDRDRNGVGPHLVGVIGRPIGAIEDYKYSDALTALNGEGQVWTVEAMQEWLTNPSGFARGTKMNFKVGSEDDRRLIAGWLAANPEG